MDDSVFDAATQELGAFTKLYLFSDGVYEITDKSTVKVWDVEPWSELLQRHALDPSQPALDQVRAQVAEIQGSDNFEDDFSLLEVIF